MNYNKIQDLNEKDQINWLRLSRTKNIGPKTFFKLLKIFDSLELALENLSDFSRQGGAKKPLTAFNKNLAEKEIKESEKIGAKIIYFCNESYPKLLREIYDPPPILTCR